MTFSWIYHIWKLRKGAVSIFISMVTRVRTILCTPCNKYPSVISLNAAKSYGYVEIYVQEFSSLLISVDIIESKDFLVKLEKVNFIG